MVLRLALTNTSNTVSSGTLIHISGMNFNNSHQGSRGSGSANSPVGKATSSAHIEGEKQDQNPVIDLTKEFTTKNLIV